MKNHIPYSVIKEQVTITLYREIQEKPLNLFLFVFIFMLKQQSFPAHLYKKTGLPIIFPSQCNAQRTGGFILSRILGQCGKSGRFFKPKKENEMTAKGYDLFYFEPGQREEKKCHVCQEKMDVQKNVEIYIAAVKYFKDAFTCPNTGENWHYQAYLLQQLIKETPSATITRLFREEVKKIVREKKATKVMPRE